MPIHARAASGTCRRPVQRHRAVLGSAAAPAATTRFGDDDLLLFLLTATWELRTARPTPPLPLTDLTEEELIEFWSDPADQDCPPVHPSTRGEASA